MALAHLAEQARTNIEGHSAATAIAGVLKRLARFSATSPAQGASDPPPTCFDAAEVPEMTIEDYAFKLLAQRSRSCSARRLALSQPRGGKTRAAGGCSCRSRYAQRVRRVRRRRRRTPRRRSSIRTRDGEFDDGVDVLLDADLPFVPETAPAILKLGL